MIIEQKYECPACQRGSVITNHDRPAAATPKYPEILACPCGGTQVRVIEFSRLHKALVAVFNDKKPTVEDIYAVNKRLKEKVTC